MPSHARVTDANRNAVSLRCSSIDLATVPLLGLAVFMRRSPTASVAFLQRLEAVEASVMVTGFPSRNSGSPAGSLSSRTTPSSSEISNESRSIKSLYVLAEYHREAGRTDRD